MRAPPMAPAALHKEIGMLSFRCDAESGAGNLNANFNRLALAILLALTLPRPASAETVAQTLQKWGLIGPWSLDCSLKADRKRGTVLDYEIVGDSRVVHRRDFGGTTDEGEVVTAEISADGMLNLRVFFPRIRPDDAARRHHARDLQSQPEERIQHQGRQFHRQRQPYSAAA